MTPKSRILGTGHFLPPNVRTNADLEAMVETTDAWITERTGIKERRIATDGMVTSDMATGAAKNALEMAGLGPKDIDMIIVGTVTPDMPMPATAVFVPPPCCVTRGRIEIFCGRCVNRTSVLRCAQTSASPAISAPTWASFTFSSAAIALLRCFSHCGDVIRWRISSDVSSITARGTESGS